MTGVSSITAMTFSYLPQFSQCSMSMSTRLLGSWYGARTVAGELMLIDSGFHLGANLPVPGKK